MQRSVRLAGYSGIGKSNLLRFLVSHPQLIAGQGGLDQVRFLYIDCNKLNPANSVNFYRECNFLLQAPDEVLLKTDAYFLYKQLELNLQKLDQELWIVLVIDRAESLYKNVSEAFFSQLRNLRDEARSGRMMFILGGQRPVGELRELERQFSDVCWVGPLSPQDEAAIFQWCESRFEIAVNPDQRAILWQLSGGHPGLLKNTLLWLKHRGQDDWQIDTLELAHHLLDYRPIQRYCEILWHNLSPTEQGDLISLKYSQPREEGLLLGGLVTAEGQLFSLLWEIYLTHNIWPTFKMPLELEINQATMTVTLQWRGRTETVKFSRKLLFNLLTLLASEPGQVFSKDEIIDTLYGTTSTEGFSDDTVFQLIKDLRKVINKAVQTLLPETTTSCIQNVRGVGYTLQVDL